MRPEHAVDEPLRIVLGMVIVYLMLPDRRISRINR
jgi:hypothetical protein